MTDINTEETRGFSDYTGEQALKREKIKQILIENFKSYGFEPAETPIIEREEFVKGENEYDEAVSDIFKLKDKGQRNLALRYEFTFQLKRLAKNKKLPYKRYQIGEVFRDEPVSANRFRQFTQADADVIGSTIKEEAEILALTAKISKDLGIKLEIQINNRKLINSIIKILDIENAEFVLREIDKIDKLGADAVKMNLNKFLDKETIVKLFRLLEKELSFFKKYEGYKEITQLISLCRSYGVKLKFKANLARGLSYYTGNIFEIKAGVKESIGAGGSYMVNNIPSTGISFGLERLSQLAKIKIENNQILIISIAQDKKAIKLAEKLRKTGKAVTIMDKITKALEYANSYNIPLVIFVGKEEVKKKKFKLRDMKTGKEEMLSETALLERLR